MNLVVGGTGSLGGKIANRLLEQGEPVRALVRPSSRYHALEAAGAEIIFGDLCDPGSLAKACKGVQTVLTTVTAPLAERHVESVVNAIDWHGYESLIDAARSAGVDQFIYTSFLGASAEAPHPLVHAKGATEAYLRASGLTYTILQPVMFMETWVGFALGAQLAQGPVVTIVGDGVNKLGFVAEDDVRDLAVAVIGKQDARNAAIPISGPASYTYREVISLIEEVLGRELAIKMVPAGGAVSGMPPILNELWAIFAGAGDVILDSTPVARRYHLKLGNMETYIRRTFGHGPLAEQFSAALSAAV